MKRILGTPMSEYMPAAGLLLITIGYLITAYGYTPDARAFPLGVAWVTLVLAALDLVSRTRTKLGGTLMHWLNPAGEPAKRTGEIHYPALKQVTAVLWIAGFTLLMVVAGILYAVPIFVFSSLYFRGKRSLLLCAAISAGATLMIWILFEQILQLELYPGLLFGDL